MGRNESFSSWILTTPKGTQETYLQNGLGSTQLTTIKARNGYTQTLTYDNNLRLKSIIDSYGRTLTIAYPLTNTPSSTAIAITTPDHTTISYGYADSVSGNLLTSVTFPTTPPQAIAYAYEDSNLPTALTRIIDESGNTYASWAYDAYGRGIKSQLGSGASLTTIIYDDATGGRKSTNALGITDTYTFTVLQNIPKVTQISRAASATTAAATRSFGYDDNGYLASETDWNGNLSTYTNNVHGLPTTVNEAVGSAIARSATIEYDPNFDYLPAIIATPGLMARFIYDASGNLLTRTLVDTTTTTSPYSTTGQIRTWTNTWSNFLLSSTTNPKGHTATFHYDNSGALDSITDALNHTTLFTSHTGGGWPVTIQDPNGVTTTLSYDARQRLLSNAVNTSRGDLTTNYTYFLNGDVGKILPDGSLITSLHDRARRLIGYADYYNNQIDWTLDAMGDVTAQSRVAFNGNLSYLRTATFDALGRQLTNQSSTSRQAWTYAYDKNGNVIMLADPLHHTTIRTFDGLNRLASSTDANGSTSQYTYDAHDRPLAIRDRNGNITSYVYDGFGDVIQQMSPDSGVTVYRYDLDGNRIQTVDASAAVSNSTYDALDRILTTAYPGDTSLNVAYTYDETGTSSTFGIGRLTSVKDAAGTLARSYDERGNLLSERRTSHSNILTTAYTYDKAGHLASITYPSGAVSSYTRDQAGNIIEMPFMASDSDHDFSLLNITHLPFGPPDSLQYPNGDRAAFTFDLDYRLNSLAYESIDGTRFLDWLYRYDANDNIISVTDNINDTYSQKLNYDALNRLTNAKSTNTYGSLAWSYDKNSNLVGGKIGNLVFASTYFTGTNRLATTTWSGNTEIFYYAPTGNISKILLNGKPALTAVYSKANRLASMNGTSREISSVIYDWRGMRFSKTKPSLLSTLYTYDQDGNLLEESDSGRVTDYIYLDGINVAIWTPGAKHLYAINFDRRGVPLLGRDEYGLTSWAAYSEPYGAMTIAKTMGGLTGPLAENLRLPGQYFDEETGLHYNRARDYIPSIGRYLETDPIGIAGGLNPYLYAEANPLVRSDASGLADSFMGFSLTPSGPWSGVPQSSIEANYSGATQAAGIQALREVEPNYIQLTYVPAGSGGGAFAIDQYGNIYAGPAGGTPGVSLTAGWAPATSPDQLSNYISGCSISAGGGDILGLFGTWTPGVGKGFNIGLTSPGAGVQGTYMAPLSPPE